MAAGFRQSPFLSLTHAFGRSSFFLSFCCMCILLMSLPLTQSKRQSLTTSRCQHRRGVTHSCAGLCIHSCSRFCCPWVRGPGMSAQACCCRLTVACFTFLGGTVRACRSPAQSGRHFSFLLPEDVLEESGASAGARCSFNGVFYSCLGRREGAYNPCPKWARIYRLMTESGSKAFPASRAPEV